MSVAGVLGAQASPEEQQLIPSPATGQPGSLTPPREFNLMFQTNVGAMSDATSVAYLRPETAQARAQRQPHGTALSLCKATRAGGQRR